MAAMTDIPDHLYEYQDIPSIPWPGEDYADPDMEPMPQLDEAIEVVRGLLAHGYYWSHRYRDQVGARLCKICMTPKGEPHTFPECSVGKAEQWLARHTNDDSSDLPW